VKRFAIGLLVTGTLSAQTAVPRPSLKAGQDTNSAIAYYGYALSILARDPVKATQGFYWATRLNPELPEPWYGLWAASVLSLPDLKLNEYQAGARTWEQDSVLHAVDSLRDRADYLNPLLHHGLDELVLKRWAVLIGADDLEQYIFGNPAFGGWLAYSRGEFQAAEERLARAIKQNPKWVGLHLDRGRAFLLQLAYDSALAEMRTFRSAIQTRQEKRTSLFMASHEMTDYSIGRIEELKGDLDKARQEYDTALIENLGFVPAHTALGRLAVTRHDTTDALREFEQATQTPDPLLDYTYGILLWASRRAPEAAAHFSRAIAADSDYSPPYLTLAYIEEGSGEDSLAVVHYQAFIARAPATLVPQLATAHQHLDALLAKKKTP